MDREKGINQREGDFYAAFEQAIDRAVDSEPDLVIHAGDLFDTVRPQNRAIDFAMRQLIRLSEAGIDTVLISGNHSSPRLRETGSIFRIFEHLPHVHPIHEPGAHRIVLGDLTVTAIPHSTTPTLADIVREVTPSKETKFNALVLHAGIVGSGVYRMDEFNEQDVPQAAISDGFDYTALGHYHRYTEVAPRIYYSGSTERLGFGEVAQAKGVLEVDLSTNRVEFWELKTRGMLDLDAIEAGNLASSEILSQAREVVSSSDIEDKVVRLGVKDVRPEAYRSLDVQAIRRLGESAMHFELKIERAEAEGRVDVSDMQIGSLAHEFQKYVSGLDYTEERKRMLTEAGLPYFEEGEE